MSDRRHPRSRRLHRAGDARPRARAPGARARRARLRLARRPAGARRSTRGLNGSLPAFVSNAEALAAAPTLVFLLPRQRARGRARAARRRASSSTSPARTGSRDAVALPAVVRLRASAPGALPTGATRCPSSTRRTGRLIANPGCYATAALLALAPLRDVDRPERRSSSTPSRASPARAATLKATLARGLRAREPLAVRGRRAPARARDRAGARLPRLLRPAPAAGPARAARDLLRRRATRTLRELLEAAYADAPVVRVLPGGRRAGDRARPGHRRRRDRRLRRPRDRPRDRRLRDRQPRQGRRRPGDAEREPRARPRPRPPGCGSQECSYERHRREGLRRLAASHAGIRRRTARPRGRPLAAPRDRRGDVHAQPRAGRCRRRLDASTSRSPSRRRS